MQDHFTTAIDRPEVQENGRRPETGSAREEARGALTRGWRPVPVPHRSKSPVLAGWNTLIVTDATFDQHFNGAAQNVAVLNGEPSGGLVDVDLDCPLAMQLASEFLPPTDLAFGRASKPRAHPQYLCEPPPSTMKFQDASGAVIVEIRSTGTATIRPGSEHPSGERVVWEEKGEPARVDACALQAAVAKLAAAVVLVRHYPNPGGRDEFKLPLIGGLLRLGWADEEIRNFVLAVATAAGDEEALDRVSGIGRARQRLLNGEPLAGWKKLAETLNDKAVVRRIRMWLDPPIHDQVPARRQRVEDFEAYLPERKYVFKPTGALWPAGSVRATVPPVAVGIDDDGEEIRIPADAWLDTHRPVHQMTWVPGEPQLVEGRILHEGGWVERPDLRCFNLYRPPAVVPGDPGQAGPWVDHVRRLYPDDADHVLAWLAHRVQRPWEKVNHALVLGGEPGIGKDTILAPVRQAAGPWNCADVSPAQAMGRFNGFLKSVIVLVSEARDLGEVNRYGFYEHMKAYTASPPDTLLCDEKFVGAYPVPNVCGLVYTTNHRTDGLYLPPNDRRHYVAWSACRPDGFPDGYFGGLYRWFDEGGTTHVAAFLAEHDLSAFDPKAPPPKTLAYWALVDAGRAPEDAELADALDALGCPEAVTIGQIIKELEKPGTAFEARCFGSATTGLGAWLEDRRNARQVPHRMESAGYVAVANPDAKDGVWKVKGRRTVIYAQKESTLAAQIAAARAIVAGSR